MGCSQIIRRILTRKTWLSIGQKHSSAHFLKHTLGNGRGKLYVTGDRLRRPYHLSRFDHVWKIRGRKQEVDIGKYYFVNRTIKNWKQLPAEALGTFPC